MSKKIVYVDDAIEALKELTAKEEAYIDPFESVFKMLEDLPPARCSDCIANGGDFECDRVHCHKGIQPLDEVIAIVAYILDCLRSYKNIVESGDCNNCVYTHCEYKPSVGQMVRYNCPFYDGGKHDLYQ